MAQDALPPIETGPAEKELRHLKQTLRLTDRDLADFFSVTRKAVSRWVNGRVQMGEREKALARLLLRAAEVETDGGETSGLGGPRRERRLEEIGAWASSIGARGLALAQFYLDTKVPAEEGTPLYDGEDIRQIRKQLGWIQAEMAAFFGVTHSTPAKWEGPDPRVGAAGEAGLLALEHFAGEKAPEAGDLGDLWQVGISAFLTEHVSWEEGIYAFYAQRRE